MQQQHQLDQLFQRLFQQLDDEKVRRIELQIHLSLLFLQSGNLRRKNVLQTLNNFYESLADEDKKLVFPADQCETSRSGDERFFLHATLLGPVVKQGALNLSKPTSESSASEEHPEGAVTNEQENIVSTENEDDEPKKTIELKNPSACKSTIHEGHRSPRQFFSLDDPNFRFVKEQAPTCKSSVCEENVFVTLFPC